jgi:hypothetical protein
MVDNSEKSMQGLPLMKGRGCIAYYHQGCYLKLNEVIIADINLCMLSCKERRVPKLSSTFL